MADYAPGQPMEEILASIKKIIAEDAPPAAVADGAVEESDAAGLEAAEPDDVLELDASLEALGQAMKQAPGDEAVAAPVEESALLSGAAEVASRQAFAALNSLTVDPTADPNTLDGLVRELLRPMLATWLDEHLPAIVERMVAREIQRLGGR